MKQPVKNKQCGHSYDKAAIEGHIRRMGQRAKCPIVGCPQIVKIQDLETDKVLARELKKRYKWITYMFIFINQKHWPFRKIEIRRDVGWSYTNRNI